MAETLPGVAAPGNHPARRRRRAGNSSARGSSLSGGVCVDAKPRVQAINATIAASHVERVDGDPRADFAWSLSKI
jgi:hypothetical protein